MLTQAPFDLGAGLKHLGFVLLALEFVDQELGWISFGRGSLEVGECVFEPSHLDPMVGPCP